MQSYTCIVRLCDENDAAEDLFVLFKKYLTNYIDKEAYPPIQSKLGDTREFLAEYINQFKQFTLFLQSIKKMFEYLDRYYLRN